MKLIYGNSHCTLHYGVEAIRSVVIKYRGSIVIKHEHMEFLRQRNKRNGLFKNFEQKSLLIHNNNQIRIGYVKEVIGEIELFRWIGNFKILSVKVNGKNVPIKVFGVDFCELIDSKFDSMGKPEQYRGTYRYGRIPQRRRKMTTKKLSTKTTARRSGGGGY